MGVVERRIREKQALRQEILDAARELFVTEGYQNVSMRKVAEKIEYSPTTIYLYFKDKAELLHSICEETFGKLSTRIMAITGTVADPVEALKAGLREYIRFGLEHPDHYRLTFMSPAELYPDPDVVMEKGSFGRVAFDHLRGGVSGCVEAGAFPQTDIDMTAQMLWCVAHGLTSNMITCPTFAWTDKDRLIETTLDTVISGLRK
jgi:AcrR family transcriptional regulator